MVVALRGHPLRDNFARILAWCVVSGALALGGGFAHGDTRGLLWLLAVGVDLAGGAVGFFPPGLGRSRTSDWTIEGPARSRRRPGRLRRRRGHRRRRHRPPALAAPPRRAAPALTLYLAWSSNVPYSQHAQSGAASFWLQEAEGT